MERILSQTSPQAAHGTKSQEQFVTVASPALPMQNWHRPPHCGNLTAQPNEPSPRHIYH